MASVRLGSALRQIHGLFEVGTVAGLTDGQLLDRYLTRRDESAFAALVMRHGPMVLGVCHAVLRGSPEVEDAFQATFLVLIRKATTIRGRDAVGGWLHRVAHRVAVQAGRDRSRKDLREHLAGDLCDDIAAVGGSPADDEWRGTLHEELARLPERFRQPVVLCYLEGKTHEQAALELRWSEATLRRRLADARGLLRSRLTRRGVAVSVAALAAAIESPAMAAVPPAWVDALARVAAGQIGAAPAASAAAARLAGRTIRGLVAGRVRAVANVVAMLLATGLLAGHLIPAGPARADDPARSKMPAAAALRSSPPAQKPRPEDRLTIRGRVLDPDGKPFAGAKVFAYVNDDPRSSDAFFAAVPKPDAVSHADGRFELAIPHPGFNTLQVQATWSHPTVAALAPGFGPAWVSFTTDDEARELTLKLVKDDVPIEGRILDLEGRPVPGVTVRPVGVYAEPGEDLTQWEAAMAGAKDLADGAMGKLPRFLELFRWTKDQPVTTDAEGRFRLGGIGRERVVSLWIEGPTIATEFGGIEAQDPTRADLPTGHAEGPSRPGQERLLRCEVRSRRGADAGDRRDGPRQGHGPADRGCLDPERALRRLRDQRSGPCADDHRCRRPVSPGGDAGGEWQPDHGGPRPGQVLPGLRRRGPRGCGPRAGHGRFRAEARRGDPGEDHRQGHGPARAGRGRVLRLH